LGGAFKTGGQIIRTVKCTDGLVLLAKAETVLQGVIDGLIEIGRCCGMVTNVENTKVVRISKQTFPINITIDKKQMENVEYFNYFCSWIANDARRTCAIKSRISMASASFKKKKKKKKKKRFSLANWNYI
jgi:hypothetical protein